MSTTTGRERAARDIAAQLILRAGNIALGIAVTVVLVRALGAAAFGEWSTILAVLMVAGYLGTIGLDQVTVERAASQPDRAAGWVGSLFALRLTLALPVMAGTAAVCALIARDDEMRIAGLITSLVLLATAFASVRVVFQLQVRNAFSSSMDVVNGIVWGAAVFIIAITGGGLVAVSVGFALSAWLTSVALGILAMRAMPLELRGARDRWRPLLSLAIPIGVGQLLIFSYGYVDQILVFRLAGAEDAGLYGAVYRILERITFIPASLMATLFPIIVAARDEDPARVARLFQLALEYLVLAALPVFVMSLVGAGPLVQLLFGSEFSAAAPALPVLMGAFLFICGGFLAGYLITTYGLQRRFVWFALAALVFNVAGNLLLVPRYGFMGAAWMTLATEALVTGLSMWSVLRRMGARPSLGRLGRIAAASAGMGVIVWGLRSAGAPLPLWIAAGMAMYPALLLALHAVTVKEFTDLLRRRVE